MSEACATNIEDLGFERGTGTLRIIGLDRHAAYVVVAFVAGG